MLTSNYNEDVFFKGVGLWVISPILITAALFFIVVAVSFGLLFEFGKYIVRISKNDIDLYCSGSIWISITRHI